MKKQKNKFMKTNIQLDQNFPPIKKHSFSKENLHDLFIVKALTF